MNKRYVLSSLFILLIAGCGGSGGDSGADEDPPVVDIMANARIINGFHLINTTGYDQFDNVISISDRTTNYDQNTLETTFNQFDPGDDTPTFTSFSTVTYDSQGRLIRDEYSDDVQSDTTSYEFNDKGLLSTSTRDGELPFSLNFVYDESDRLVSKRRQWLDADGVAVLSVVDYTYNYNSQGLLDNAYQEENGSPDPITGETLLNSETRTYLRDNRGRITRRMQISTSGDSSDEVTRISDYSYDENGNVVEEIITGPFGVDRLVRTYEQSEEPIFNTMLRRFLYFP